MLFLGLGTGLGSALIVDGSVHAMELAHLPYKRGSYEDYVGIRGLEKHGKKKWRRLAAKNATQTTVAVLRDVLGKIPGGLVRFARLAKRSPSWVKKVSAGIVPLSQETARLLELETGVALDWLMQKKPPFGPPVNGRGKPYTLDDFKWHQAGAKAGAPRIRSIGYPFNYALKIAAIGAAAGEQGKASLFLWRLRTFLEECAEEFGVDERARSLAESELRKAPRLTRTVFYDKGFDLDLLTDKRVIRAAKEAAKNKAPGAQVTAKVTLPPKREKKQRKR